MTLSPIGHVRCNKQLKFETPHQPSSEPGETNLVELTPGRQFDLALQDLAGFDRIWLISWFDRNTSWRPRPLPPRGAAKRRGLFATRSPHRPNPIGLTCVPLIAVEGLTLIVGPLDLVDGTPILDIKPYIRTVDSFPESSLGWIGEVEDRLASSPKFEIEVSDLARRQLTWLRDRWQIDFTDRAFGLLRQDPTPHRTRRILQLGDGLHRMACGPWRLYYRIEGQTVVVESVGKGYSDESLAMEGHEEITDRQAQIEFAQQEF
ncbi:MAG: tRNA (N6-threonylcarbamoyladenosine(37)-N6)-methyltransferase TrmO [Chlorobia bacterium]|nr:tRNA (N6-threonylcarbamoyladenosine(37)-N6)-methyltransferase TrmO [Fimbriimonadaceae bacterium]